MSYLKTMCEKTSTEFWNDSAPVAEIKKALSNGANGVTTNPPLIWMACESDKGRWSEFAVKASKGNSSVKDEDIAWAITREMVCDAAKTVYPLYKETDGKRGLVSIQVNPAMYRDSRIMIEQAKLFAGFAPNLAIKIPATAAGLIAVEELAANGINTTATVSFTVPQVMNIEAAFQRGLQRFSGKKKPQCFAVLMAGRLDDWLRIAVKNSGTAISEEVICSAGISVVKKANDLFRKGAFKSRLLIGGMRGLYHITDFCGGDMILTIPPKYQADLESAGIAMDEKIKNPVDGKIIRELEKVEDFNRAYNESGMKPEEFENFGSNVTTQGQFIDAYNKLVEFVGAVRKNG